MVCSNPATLGDDQQLEIDASCPLSTNVECAENGSLLLNIR